MNKQPEKSKNNSSESDNSLRKWESPELFIENMQVATEGGADINPFEPDDMYYAS
jgi:hypothetical protein